MLARRIFGRKGQRRLRVRLRDGDTTEFFFGLGMTALSQELKGVRAMHSFPKVSMNEVLGQCCSLPAMHKVSGKDRLHLHLEFTLQVMGDLTS